MKLTLLALLLSGSVFAAGPIQSTQTSYATTNQSATTWGTLISSLSKEANYLDIYTNSSTGTLILGIGAYGHEYNALYIAPGTSRVIPLKVPKYSRISLKGLNKTVNTGESIINFME